MDVRCERCRAQYVFDDDQVTPAGLTVQCTNCGHLFKVRKKELVVTVPVKAGDLESAPLPANAGQRAGTSQGVPAARPATSQGVPAARPATSQGVQAPTSWAGAPGAPAAAPPAHEPEERSRDREWRVRQSNGNIFTFREMTTLQKWIIEQKVARDDEISLQGDQWKRLGNIPELASFFQVVEAAERSKLQQLQPGITPMPNVTPMPMQMPAVTPMPMGVPVPMYGVAIQQPMYPSGAYAPPPPMAQPSTSGAYPMPGTPSGPYPVAPAPILPPVHEVDLGMDAEPPRKKGRGWLVALLLVVLAGAGAAAYFTLFAAPPPPPPAPPPPPPKQEVQVPITIEVKPVEPPPAPVPAPEPVVEPPKPPVVEKKPVPMGPKAMIAKARALLEKGQTDAALELFGRVASSDPSNVEALTGRGLCYLDLENYPPAEASFEAALRLEPEDADAMLGIAQAYENQGKKAEAIAAYEKYLARHAGEDDAEVAKRALEQLRK